MVTWVFLLSPRTAPRVRVPLRSPPPQLSAACRASAARLAAGREPARPDLGRPGLREQGRSKDRTRPGRPGPAARPRELTCQPVAAGARARPARSPCDCSLLLPVSRGPLCGPRAKGRGGVCHLRSSEVGPWPGRPREWTCRAVLTGTPETSHGGALHLSSPTPTSLRPGVVPRLGEVSQ